MPLRQRRLAWLSAPWQFRLARPIDSCRGPSSGSYQTIILRPKHLILGSIVPVVLALDLITKRWALDALAIQSSEIFGGLMPLTLAFNKGAAFGMRIGEDSRWFFVPITIVALVLLGVLYRQALERDYLRITSISLVVSGALGNLYDRVRWDRGVVDFLGPVDLGFWDFPIFNVADMAITCGAILLAVSFWIEEQNERAAESTQTSPDSEAADPDVETAPEMPGTATISEEPTA